MWAIIWGYSETLATPRKQSDIQTSVFTEREKAMVTTTTSKPTTKSSEQLIEEYHLEAKQRCLAAYENDTHLQGYYCPCLPTTFGKLRTRNILHYDQSNRVAVETTAVPTKSVGHGSGWVLNFREAC